MTRARDRVLGHVCPCLCVMSAVCVTLCTSERQIRWVPVTVPSLIIPASQTVHPRRHRLKNTNLINSKRKASLSVLIKGFIGEI